MGRLSLLPDSLVAVEVWAARFFLLLALLVFGPWVLVLVYDVVLYLWRSITYDPAQERPRAPSLRERPDGQPRDLSIADIAKTAFSRDDTPTEMAGTTSRRATRPVPGQVD